MIGPPDGSEILEIRPEDWDSQLEQTITKIESQFHHAIRDTTNYLKSISEQKDGIFLVARLHGKTVGYIAGGKLENFGDIPGVKEDSHYGVGDTIYAESLAVLRSHQEKGIGRHLVSSFLLRARREKFRYMSGHVEEKYTEQWGGTPIRSIPNYYGSGLTFEYFRRDLRSGDWVEGCRTMMTVQAILSGFSATVLAVLFSVHLPSFGYPAIAFVMVALTLFIYSAEKSTDALDQRNANVYLGSLVSYNFAVTFFLIGVSLSVLGYGAAYWAEVEPSPTSLVSILLATLVPILASFHWLIDGLWLLRRDNRAYLPNALEYGEGQ